jgi:NAD(P)-dependent dehydrogenase (short-subunit alcohol dehydrogenase family)
MSLKNKTALVTGASRGLGAALARKLCERGASVVLVARDGRSLQTVVDDIASRGGRAFALPADIADKAATHPLAFAAMALVGPLDVLVHNASTLGPTPLRLLLDTDCEDLSRVLEVNLVGPFRLTKILASTMALRGSGTVVHVSSDASIAPYPTWGAYSVSKAAQDHLARIWAAELGEHGVRSFSVDPGEMNTRMHADAVPDADPKSLLDPEVVAANIVRMIEAGSRVPNGARLEATTWRDSS